MGDSWEDWEEHEVALPAVNGTVPVVDTKKFEDEDQEEEAPKWMGSIPEPQQASNVHYLNCIL